MKLTAPQIDHLFVFTRQHFIEWYDLQSEIVDHLANAIETEWQENPNLSFEQALSKEFKKFGVFGFMDLVEEKKKCLSKKYNSIVWFHLKSFFGIPKIGLTALGISVVYFLLKQIQEPKAVILSFYVTFLIVIFYKLLKNKNQQKKEKRKWLFKEIIFNYGSTTGIFVFIFQILNSFINDAQQFLGNGFFLFLTSVFLVFMIVFGFIVLFIIPAKSEEYLSKTYPEYKL